MPATDEDKINELYETVDENLTYLIFSVGKESFAIKTLLVQEIMHSAKIHPLPFVPDYIEGVVNCHGVPFTVVNTLKMSGSQECEKFLSLRGMMIILPFISQT